MNRIKENTVREGEAEEAAFERYIEYCSSWPDFDHNEAELNWECADEEELKEWF